MRDVEAFRIFKQVADHGSFTKAAAALEMNKNSVGVSIQLLERRMGVKLLGRTTTKVWLTEAGKRYYEAYSRVLEEVARARDHVAGKEDKTKKVEGGQLHIEAPSIVASRLLAPHIAEFLTKHSNLTIKLSTSPLSTPSSSGEGRSTRPGDLTHLQREMPVSRPSALHEHDEKAQHAREDTSARLVFRFVPDAQEAIFSSPHIVVASTSYLARNEAPLRPEELSDHSCITLHQKKLWTLQSKDSEHAVSVDGRFDTDCEESAVQMLFAGVGVAFLPAVFVQREAALGLVRRLLPSHQGAHEHLIAHYPDGEFSSPWPRFFVDFLRARL